MTADPAVAARMALATAERLLDPTSITGPSLDGLAGTALLHARLSAVDQVFADAAGRHWAAAINHATQAPGTGTGIYSTPAGIAASMIIGTPYLPDPAPHPPAVQHAVRWLTRQATRIAAEDQARRADGKPFSSWAGYDLISGPTGLGRVLLAAHSAGHTAAEQGLHGTLTNLTLMITSSADSPGWLILPQEGQGPRLHPSGEAATGMAHGIAGPLAFLSIAHSAGYTVHRQTDAIRTAARWLAHWQSGRCWPPAITGDELTSGIPDPMPGRRDAWCYGIPGIARALHLAGNALGDPHLTHLAQSSLEAMAGRYPWDVEGPTICHGYAGIIQSTRHHTSATAERAEREVAAACDPQFTYQFCHASHSSGSADRAGLLTGAAGIALVLADLGALPSVPAPTPWDAVLLLSLQSASCSWSSSPLRVGSNVVMIRPLRSVSSVVIVAPTRGSNMCCW
jgi:hypothetical protein